MMVRNPLTIMKARSPLTAITISSKELEVFEGVVNAEYPVSSYRDIFKAEEVYSNNQRDLFIISGSRYISGECLSSRRYVISNIDIREYKLNQLLR